MSRRAARFTQADLERALRAAQKVGARVAVEITPAGAIRLEPVEAESQAAKPLAATRDFRL
jgi:hypothetical protein